jgi:hypothetical protein
VARKLSGVAVTVGLALLCSVANAQALGDAQATSPEPVLSLSKCSGQAYPVCPIRIIAGKTAGIVIMQ